MLQRLELPLSRWTKLALALVGAFLLAESRTQASCSDHTVFSFASFSQDSPPTGVRGGQLPARPSTGKPSEAPPCDRCPVNPFEAPCRGPGCSGNNLPEGLPITTDNVNVTQDQWNVALMHALRHTDEQIDWLALSQTVSPVSRTDSIFHPPRHG